MQGSGAGCAEAVWAAFIPLAGLVLLPWTPAIFVYASLVIVGSWSYPLLTVRLAPPGLRRHAAYADAHVARADHSGDLPGADIPPGTSSLSTGAQSQPAETVAAAGPNSPSGRSQPAQRAVGRRCRQRKGDGEEPAVTPLRHSLHLALRRTAGAGPASLPHTIAPARSAIRLAGERQ